MTAAPRQGFWCCSCTSTCTKKGIRPEKLVILDEPKLGLQQVGSGETLHRNGNAPETPVHCKSAKLPHWVKSRMKYSGVGNRLFWWTIWKIFNFRKTMQRGKFDVKVLVQISQNCLTSGSRAAWKTLELAIDFFWATCSRKINQRKYAKG